MRTAPASYLKGRKTNFVASAPRKGTKLRALYDLFMANKGVPVSFNRSGCNCRRFCDLQDYYGLDIHHVRMGQWVLAGEWIGPEYRDYITENFNLARAA